MTPLKATVAPCHLESFGRNGHNSTTYHVLNISLPNGDIVLSQRYDTIEQANAIQSILNNGFSPAIPFDTPPSTRWMINVVGRLANLEEDMKKVKNL
jgi:hypothetical protein